MLLAEDLMLLLLDDDSGRVSASTYLDQVLGGALLVELALAGNVEVRGGEGRWARQKVHVTPGVEPPEDRLLAEKLVQVAERERSARDLVGRLGRRTKDAVLQRLVERGLVQRTDDRVLGLFPRHRWPAVDSRHEDEVRRSLVATLAGHAVPDARTAALVALLAAVDQAHRVVEHPGLTTREVRRRAKEVAEDDWAAKAVRDSVRAAQAAVVASVSAAGAAAGTG